ncbi:MAG: DUF4831 family protein, partial [Dysgonamonadaceae bacterium]
ITLKTKKTTYRRGEFYAYARRYLGIENPISEDKTVYSLENVAVTNKGIPDKINSFMVEFRPNTMEPFVYLTEEGLICTINAMPEIKPAVQTEQPPKTKQQSVDPRRFFSEEILMAGSTAKQAELVAKQILELRRSRNDILIGEAENMPPDGEAYKVVMDHLDLQEKVLTEMFTGTVETETFTTDLTLVPEDKNIDRKVIARFSTKLGPVDADNLAGAPIYLSLINKTPKPEMRLSEKELQQLEKKLKEGLVYNIPSKAELKIEYNNQIIKNTEVDVVQFGSKEVLTKKMFDSCKKPIQVIFYPELGAIKQIIQ